ncbi:MAG: glycosyltransferase 87 family protein [Vicinamibacterales bacterium]
MLVATLAGLVLGFVVFVATSRGLTTIQGGRIGGDLPAFYGAGRLVRLGESRDLYDWRAQRTAQSDLFQTSEQGWIPFSYPPYVAAIYAPLTVLSFKSAYVAFTILMACCCLGAVALLRPALAIVRRNILVTVTLTLTFYPVLRAVLGGQNTAVSLLCAAGAANAMGRGRSLSAGLWVGVWLFKPQLALPVAALLALRTPSKVRFLSGVALVAIAYYLLGVFVGGSLWPLWWWREGARPFESAVRVIDRTNSISLIELAAGYGVAVLGWCAAVGIAMYVTWLAWRQTLQPVALVGAACATAVLIAPHALYYDGGLALIALLATADLRPTARDAVIVLWFLAWLQPVRGSLPVPPITIVTGAALWLVTTVVPPREWVAPRAPA